MKDNQNRYEDELLYRFREVVPDGVKVTLVADRGFADCNFFKILEEELGFDYVIRLPGSYYVTSETGGTTLGFAVGRAPTGGPARCEALGSPTLTACPSVTVVCLHDKKMKDLLVSGRK